MSEAPAPVTESELHAYLDGELTPARIDEVEAHFLADEADALRFGIYRRQSDLMRRLYGQLKRQPVSNELLPLIPAVVRLRPRRSWLGSLFVSLLVLTLGGAAGWFGHLYYDQMKAAVAAPLNEALAAHRISIQRRPTGVEVLGGDGRATLEWLGREFGFRTTSLDPELVGFTLLGGELIPSPVGIAAQLQLRAGPDERLTLYVQPGGSREITPFRSASAPRERMVSWQANGASLVLVGRLPEEEMTTIAEAIQAGLVEPAEPADEPT
jgi:anti-sigma factor RsiW